MAQGKEAWNSWAEQMLAQKSPFPHGEAGRAWAERARADFGGVNFTENCDFAGFVFPGEAEFWPALKKGADGTSPIPTYFHKRASFNGAKFLGRAWFAGAVFKDEASFPEGRICRLGEVQGRDLWQQCLVRSREFRRGTVR